MGMAKVAKIWTVEDVQALPEDGNRYELVDGELLVSPAPRGRHQVAVWALFRILDPYVAANRLGQVGMAPADLDLGAQQLVQPDLFVGRMYQGRIPIAWPEWRVPLLIVEVLSPSTARADRLVKRTQYQRAGVDTYWVVDLDARVMEVWTPEADRPRIVAGTLTWHPVGASDHLTIDLAEYFQSVWPDQPAGG